MKKEINLKEDKIISLLIKYSIPSIVAMLVTSLYNTIDRAFVGSIKSGGAEALSALGVAMPLFTIIGAFCVAIAIGGNTNISIKLGEDNNDLAEKYLGTTVFLEILAAIFIIVINITFLDQILYFFGGSDLTVPLAKDYMIIILLFSILNLPGFALNGAIRSEGNPKLAANMMVLGCILNMILDPIFIFVFDLKIAGAAIGTVICQVLIFLWSSYYFTFGKSKIKLKLSNIKFDKRLVKDIIKIGITPFLMEIATGFIFVVTNIILKSYGGDLAIGAMTAITSIGLLFLMPVYGLSQGMQTIIAYNIGAKLYNRAKKALYLAITFSTGFLSIGLIIILNFKGFFIGLFSDDVALINLAKYGISINLITLPTIGIVILGTVYFQTIGYSKRAMFLSLTRSVIYLLPILYFMPKVFNIFGIFASQPLADILAMVTVLIMIIKDRKNNLNCIN
ncbi:MATE family efflux transporter [Clostridium sp. LY3-2]|uniref:MATE family efflux transporter n=1 Tax=Clostridium sp. LY3-2 TaxID=2942482 RepID=UPI0021520250|nr:MATE family efflux transporter [Clostridium sp. LY3-2]MCR6514040.1 MATE family efflux transporter [Clostridium sp. LY3-2]